MFPASFGDQPLSLPLQACPRENGEGHWLLLHPYLYHHFLSFPSQVRLGILLMIRIPGITIKRMIQAYRVTFTSTNKQT